jgi:PBP1b-binding outer membrane lipoprotein LpoB
MRKLHMILACLLILAVLFSGCVGKKAAEQPSQEQVNEAGLEGNLSVPGEKDLLVEEPLISADENVDMGSLI